MKFITTAVAAATLAATLATPAAAYDRRARVIFNMSLPPLCAPGWNGRGIGLVATCRIGWRAHIRFINGYVLSCAVPDCRDQAPRIDAFLRQNGY